MIHGHLVDLPGSPQEKALNVWFETRANYARAHLDAFQSQRVTWAQRLSILALPISAMLLGIQFVFRRGVYMFDRLIFSMHSLSFQGQLLSSVLALENLSDAWAWLAVASPVHLFVHLKAT